jgi:hypothetical protein
MADQNLILQGLLAERVSEGVYKGQEVQLEGFPMVELEE